MILNLLTCEISMVRTLASSKESHGIIISESAPMSLNFIKDEKSSLFQVGGSLQSIEMI